MAQFRDVSLKLVQPGDCLLYRGEGFFSWAIRVKTWSVVSHVEVAIEHGLSVASRDGVGVNSYPRRAKELFAILRPTGPVDLESAMRWFNEQARGQPYDWIGLLNFITAKHRGEHNRAQFCSEFATRFYRRAGFDVFHEGYDADTVAPADFFKSPVMLWIDRADWPPASSTETSQ